MSVVKKSYRKEWIYRLETLKETIDKWVNDKNVNKCVATDKLFYDT